MEEKYERKGRERINRTKGRPTQYKKPTHHRRRPATSKQKRGEKKEKESAAAEALLLARNMTTRTTLLLQRFGGSDWTIHFNCKIPATTSNHAKSSSSSVSGLMFATTGSRKASNGQLYGCRSVRLSPAVRLLPSALRHRRQKSYSRGYVCEGRGGTGGKEATFPWMRTHYDHQVGKLFAALFFANVQTRSVPSVSLISRLFFCCVQHSDSAAKCHSSTGMRVEGEPSQVRK